MLHTAHAELQRIVTTPAVERFSHIVRLYYTDIGYNGLWFTPLREALDAYVDKIQEHVTGVVRLKLFKGDCRGVGRKSPFALSDPAATAYDAPIWPASIDVFDRAAEAGFTKIDA